MVPQKLLSFSPRNFKYMDELWKQICYPIILTNNTDKYVAFKINLKNHENCVLPNTGIIMPHSTADMIVSKETQREARASTRVKDKFIIKSVIITPETTSENITDDMFKKGSGNICKVIQTQIQDVTYTLPPQPPPVPQKGSNEGKKMIARGLLSIHPQNLQFPFELNKQSSCTMQLTNDTNNYIAFKVKFIKHKLYSACPNIGIVIPHSTLDVLVKMQAQREAPADMQCKDIFLIQSVITTPETVIDEDVTNDTFTNDSESIIEQKVKVSYIPPPQPPSIAQEGSTEGNLISIHPQELQFPFELNKMISCSLQLTNNTESYVAFKVNSTIIKKSCVLPTYGIVLPCSTYHIKVVMEAQKEAPTNMESNDIFLIQSAITTRKDIIITDDMFKKESGNVIDCCGLKVSYVSPSQPPSAAQKRSDEGGTVLDNEGELLSIHPGELQIPFKLNKEMFCTIKLTNNTDSYVAFKVKTTDCKKYCVRPYIGIVMPLSIRYLLVMIQAQEEVLTNMECKDKFLLLSVIVTPETIREDIISDMFNSECGNVVNERKLKVFYVSPSQTLLAALQRMD